MKRVPTSQLIHHAFLNHYAVPAINGSNLETIRAILETASAYQSPVIVQVAPLQAEVQSLSFSQILDLVEVIAKNIEGGIYAVHLDHGETLAQCKACLDYGFNSVMIDASKLPFKENIEHTRAVKQLFKEHFIEGELGAIVGDEGSQQSHHASLYTELAQVKPFVEQTGVDMLAVAIGNVHGVYKAAPNLQFELLKQIHESVDLPLVLHGASGLSHQEIKQACLYGVSKVNFFTEINAVFKQAIKTHIEDQNIMLGILDDGRRAMCEAVAECIEKCCSGGRI